MKAQQHDPKESGVLLVDKPEDWTSHDLVNLVRRRFRIKKVGHCGTLDPIATGLVVLVLGRATKLSSRLMCQDKEYSGTMRLGIETHSQDRAGEVTATREIDGIDEERIRAVMQTFVGDLMQIPPMVSALKRDGKRLYELARQGVEVEREPRPITISRLDIHDIHLPFVDFSVACTKGTYVRTLCADIGGALGCGAHLHALRRTRSGSFTVSDAHTVDHIKSWDRETLLATMTPLADIVVHLMEVG